MATGAGAALVGFRDQPEAVVAGLALIVYSTVRTVRPVLRRRAGTDPLDLTIELVVPLAAVLASGGWDSPLVFTLLVPVVIAGFSDGYRGGFQVAGVATLTLGLVGLVVDADRSTPEALTEVALVLVATGAVAGFARRIFLEAEASQEAFADRMGRLAQANTLLAQLTQVARTLPSSLDLGDTLVAAMGHLRTLLDFGGAAVLVRDPATDTWRPEASAGLPSPAPVPTAGLPAPARAAVHRSVVVVEPELGADTGPSGLWPSSRSGLYAPLVARDRVVALAVLEHSEPSRFGPRETEVIAGLADSLALAIDNALWFERLRSLGADSERERLARSLHDRVAQGLAYVGLELDRLARSPGPRDDLIRLRAEVGGLLAEVRETLHQLRAKVTETTGFVDLVNIQRSRYVERTGIDATFHDGSGGRRLPVPVEQELWRILQESVSNVERHAGASALVVDWRIADGWGRLRITDDGAGFAPSRDDGPPGSGLMTMRERANAIGARLAVESEPGKGTTVAVEVEAK